MASILRRRLQNAELLELLAVGDERAVRELHDRYHRPLVRYAASLLGWSSQDAEDVVQDVLVAALRVIAAGARPTELRPWLYRLVRNRAIDEVRRSRRRDVSLDLAVSRDAAWQTPPEQEPSSVAGRRESLRELVIDLSELPDAQREALLARVVDGASPKESAERLGVSVAAAQMLVVRGRESLKRVRDARAATGDPDRQLRALAPPVGLLGALGMANMFGCGAKVTAAVATLVVVAAAGGLHVVRHQRAGAGDPAPFGLPGAGAIVGQRVFRGDKIPAGTAVVASTVRIAAGDPGGRARVLTLQCPAGTRYAAQLSHQTGASPVSYRGPMPWEQSRADGRVTFRFAQTALRQPATVRVRILCRKPGKGGSLLANPRLPHRNEGHGEVCSRDPYVYRDPEHLFVGSVFRGQQVTVTRTASRSAYVITDDGVRGWIKTADLCPGWTAAAK